MTVSRNDSKSSVHPSIRPRKLIQDLKGESRLAFHPAVRFRLQQEIFHFRTVSETVGAERTNQERFHISPRQLFAALRTNQLAVMSQHGRVFKTVKTQLSAHGRDVEIGLHDQSSTSSGQVCL